MSFNDPIAELLTNIRNAKDAKHKFLDVSLTKIRVSILQIMKNKGFIENFLVGEEKKKIRIFLKYTKERKSVIRGLKRVSRPGLRKYIKSDALTSVFGGMGFSILSTSKGVMDNIEARKQKVGGELICNIW